MHYYKIVFQSSIIKLKLTFVAIRQVEFYGLCNQISQLGGISIPLLLGLVLNSDYFCKPQH